jgi:myosin heavy subunit
MAVVSFSCGANALRSLADDPIPADSTQVRNLIEQQKLKRQESEKELVLRQGAATVSAQRVEEIQKQLAEAQARMSAENLEAKKLQDQTAALEKQIVDLTTAIPQHEAADLLVVTANKASARLDALKVAQQQLQSQLATLRKSSVEWRSKATDAEQQIAAITAQRPELDKKVTETKAAADAAEVTVTTALTAMAAAQTTSDSIAAVLKQEDVRFNEATAALAVIANSLSSVQKSLTAIQEAAQLSGVDSAASVQTLEKAVADFAQSKSGADAMLVQFTARRDEQSKLLATATAELEKKVAEHKAAVAAAEPMKAAHNAAVEAIASTNIREAAMKVLKVDGEMWQKTLQSQLMGLEPSLQKLNAEMQIVSNETLVAKRQAEAALEPLGRFVSFSRHVAPILAERCIACHNTRSPGGRLNLDSFAAMSKGGESGAAVSAHKSAESLLLTMIEDGSMPKDADPLKADEIAVVKHWINVGAPLDAGIALNADLFDVMPERSQSLFICVETSPE